MSDEKQRVTDQQYAANGLRRMAPGESKAAMDPKRVNGTQPDFSIDRENITEVDPATGEEIAGPKSANGPARAKTAAPFRDPKAIVVDSTEMTGLVAEEAGAVQFVSASLDAPPPSSPLPLAAGMNAENIARLAQALSGEAENAPGSVGGENVTETVKEGPVEVLPAAATPSSPPAEDKAEKPAADAGQNAVIETAEVADPAAVPVNKDGVSAEAAAEGIADPLATPVTAPAPASGTLREPGTVARESFLRSRPGQIARDIRKAWRAAGPAAAWIKDSLVPNPEDRTKDLEKLKQRKERASLAQPAADEKGLKGMQASLKQGVDDVMDIARRGKAQVREARAHVAARLGIEGKTATSVFKSLVVEEQANPPEAQPKATPTVADAASELPPNLSAGTQAAPRATDQEAPAKSGTAAPIKPAAPEVASAEAKTQPPQPEKTAAVSPGETGNGGSGDGENPKQEPPKQGTSGFENILSITKPIENPAKPDFMQMLRNWQALLQTIADDPESGYHGEARLVDKHNNETEDPAKAAAISGTLSRKTNSDFKLHFRATGSRLEATLDNSKGPKYIDEQQHLAAYVFALAVVTTWKLPENSELPLVIGGSADFRKYFAQALQDPEMQKIAVERGLKKINFVTEVGKTTPDTIKWTEEDGVLHSFNHIVFAPPAAKPAPAPPPPKPDPAEAPPANAAVDSSEAGQAKSAANPPLQPVNAGTDGTATAEVPAEKGAAKTAPATPAAAAGGEVIPPVKAASAAKPAPVQVAGSGADQANPETIPPDARAEGALREVIYLPPPEKMPPLKEWSNAAEEIADADTLEREEPALQRRATRVPLRVTKRPAFLGTRAQSEQNRRRIVRHSFQTVRKKIEINHVLARSKGELPNRPVALGRAARRGSNAPVKRLERV
jgi:hypothetical protein